MLVRIFNLILLSLLAMLFFIIIQKPFEIDISDYKIGFKSLEANDLIGFEIKDKLVKKAYVKHYYKIDNKEVFNDFIALEKSKNIKSDEAVKFDKKIILSKNVIYKDEKITLNTELIEYDLDEKTMSSNEKTKVVYEGNILNANSFIYNTISGKLTLKEVDLCIEN